MVDLRNRELTQELMGNVQKIVKGTAEDFHALCRDVSKEEIERRNYYLSPDLYFEVPRQVLWRKLHRQCQFGFLLEPEKSA